jgi:uncharacterized repeat protein (TIGR03803 family)
MKLNLRRWLDSRCTPFGKEVAAVTAAIIVAGIGGDAHAQTLTILHSFTTDVDHGSVSEAALTLDGSTGGLFGTTFYGGELSCDDGAGCGNVFELGPSVAEKKSRPFQQIHAFGLGRDGTHPFRGLVMDRDGNLYGTTATGGSQFCGSQDGCGVVFMLSAQKDVSGSWVERILHVFLGGEDGADPGAALYRDAKTGVLYGTACYGGSGLSGTVFSLAPRNAARTEWAFKTLFGFRGGADGACPRAPVTMSRDGNLYGTTFYGGLSNEGTAFVLSPKGEIWTETVIHNFNGHAGDGVYPDMGLVADYAGNFIGATANGGRFKNGAIYQLSHTSSGWTESVLHSFNVTDGSVPVGDRLAIDAAGNLYGATQYGGLADYGTVFQLVPAPAGRKYNVLYNFCFIHEISCNDGEDPQNPQGGVILDAAGNIYGTTSAGGGTLQLEPHNGTVFMLTR